MTAAVVGLETVCRVAAAAPHGFHARGLHATMVAGVFSAAVVSARLMGLSAAGTTNALGIAGSQAGGLLAFLAAGASTKQVHPGFASQSGIIAARLAAAGATGPATVFDGPHGVFDALASGTVHKGSITDGLGERWETTRIGIKPYPACQLAHVEALGFCGEGEVLDFIQPGRIRPGGALPLDTSGGGLSYCHPGQYGVLLLIEAVGQLRGSAGARQVPGARTAVAHGTGGILSTHATVVLGVR